MAYGCSHVSQLATSSQVSIMACTLYRINNHITYHTPYQPYTIISTARRLDHKNWHRSTSTMYKTSYVY